MAISYEAGIRFSRRWCMLWIRVQCVVLFLLEPGIMAPGIKGWQWDWHRLAHFLLPVPVILSSAGPELLVPKRGVLPPGVTRIPLNWRWNLPPSHCGLLMLLNQQAKKGVYCAGWGDWAWLAGETRLLCHNGGKEEWNILLRRSLRTSGSITMSHD